MCNRNCWTVTFFILVSLIFTAPVLAQTDDSTMDIQAALAQFRRLKNLDLSSVEEIDDAVFSLVETIHTQMQIIFKNHNGISKCKRFNTELTESDQQMVEDGFLLLNFLRVNFAIRQAILKTHGRQLNGRVILTTSYARMSYISSKAHFTEELVRLEKAEKHLELARVTTKASLETLRFWVCHHLINNLRSERAMRAYGYNSSKFTKVLDEVRPDGMTREEVDSRVKKIIIEVPSNVVTAAFHNALDVIMEYVSTQQAQEQYPAPDAWDDISRSEH